MMRISKDKIKWDYGDLLDGKRKTIAVYSGDVGEARRLETMPEGGVSG
jgi:hypothetical protein